MVAALKILIALSDQATDIFSRPRTGVCRAANMTSKFVAANVDLLLPLGVGLLPDPVVDPVRIGHEGVSRGARHRAPDCVGHVKGSRQGAFGCFSEMRCDARASVGQTRLHP
jgi:hypothetical protein